MIVAPIVGTDGEEEEDDDAIIPQITFGADGGFVLDTARFLAFDFCIPRSLKKKELVYINRRRSESFVVLERQFSQKGDTVFSDRCYI